MRSMAVLSSLILLVLALGPVGAQVADPVAEVNRQLSGLDLDGDGTAEIRGVRSIGAVREAEGSCLGTVLVAVQSRLLAPDRAEVGDWPLPEALATYAQDLADEGWRAVEVEMDLYDGARHQDGRTLLAVRRYVLALSKVFPDLAGVVLVGRFPEAQLVRQYNWRQRVPTVLHSGASNQEDFGGREVCRLRSRAELVAGRSDLPLADVDGKWEDLYRLGPDDLPNVMAVYPDAEPPAGQSAESDWPIGGPTAHVETGTDRFEDFFFINDGQYELTALPDGRMDLKLLDSARDQECSPADLSRGNPMAYPELLVSRIDTSHVALRPQSSVVDAQGDGLLNAGGLPREVIFPSPQQTPRGLDIWEPDPDLELRLLCEYFDRNHRYRKGAFSHDLRPASAAFELDSFMGEFRQARPDWADLSDASYDLNGDGATLDAVVEWLKRPAVLRAIAAHSDPWGATFKKADPERLAQVCGGTPWSWLRRENRLVPSLGATGKLDYAILRTLWQNGVLPDSASLYVHSGCEITMPAGAATLPYGDPSYAHWQGAEALLYYAKGLALVGRSKVFYDAPTGFAAQLGAGKTFGDAWRYYFDTEAAETDVAKVGGGIGRKRAYFWGVLGDWTLRVVG